MSANYKVESSSNVENETSTDEFFSLSSTSHDTEYENVVEQFVVDERNLTLEVDYNNEEEDDEDKIMNAEIAAEEVIDEEFNEDDVQKWFDHALGQNIPVFAQSEVENFKPLDFDNIFDEGIEYPVVVRSRKARENTKTNELDDEEEDDEDKLMNAEMAAEEAIDEEFNEDDVQKWFDYALGQNIPVFALN